MKVVGAATVLQVSDVDAALVFYRDVLGFEQDFRFEQYVGVHFGELHVHLCAHHAWRRPVGGGAVSVFCDEIDRYCEQVRGRGARIALEPTDEPYGMRDFAVRDPDGNVLTFGRDLSVKSSS